jgi:hypothetical protein
MDSLQKREVAAPNNTTTRNDPATIESWGAQKDYFLKKNFEIIPWEKAEVLLLERKIASGKQYHTGWATLFGHAGEKFLTHQPVMDAIYTFAKQHDLELKNFGTE